MTKSNEIELYAQAKTIYTKMTSYANYSEMNGISRDFMLTQIVQGLKLNWNMALDHAAENAESEYGNTVDTHKVDKQSILKHKYEL